MAENFNNFSFWGITCNKLGLLTDSIHLNCSLRFQVCNNNSFLPDKF